MKECWIYRAEMVRIIDGDTIRFKVDMGFYNFTEQHFRLIGIDTPEIRGEERPLGLISKAYVEKVFEQYGNKCLIRSYKHGKYRWLCEVFIDRDGDGIYEFNLNQELLNEGLAEQLEY